MLTAVGPQALMSAFVRPVQTLRQRNARLFRRWLEAEIAIARSHRQPEPSLSISGQSRHFTGKKKFAREESGRAQSNPDANVGRSDKLHHRDADLIWFRLIGRHKKPYSRALFRWRYRELGNDESGDKSANSCKCTPEFRPEVGRRFWRREREMDGINEEPKIKDQ